MDKKKRDVIKILADSQEDRIEEQITRPRVEAFVDNWAAWVAYHKAEEKSCEFSPHSRIGWH